MAKRKKATAKPAALRRTTRRGKQQSEAEPSSSADGETSTASEPTTSETSETTQNNPESAATEESSAIDPQTSDTNALSKSSLVPTVVLHKKFGKYRCLFNNDDTFSRKYDLGSDSETNSSVEIKVVDPCASSESDSNAGLDARFDANSGANSSPKNSTINTPSVSRDLSPVLTTNLEMPCSEIPLPPESKVVEDKSIAISNVDLTESDTKSSDSISEPTSQIVEQPNMEATEFTNEEAKDDALTDYDIPYDPEQLEFTGDDDEVITIVQIVEDDNPDMYYNIKIDSPKDGDEESENNSHHTDFQSHFEKLNLTSTAEPRSPMDCTETHDLVTPPCVTPDPHFSKDGVHDALMRPDPSITPSSTLSDDSNSSRMMEQHPNNSNDSSESSPSGVRRSSRIKTISNLKQKTKGYGLVKTPLKKALITQAKLKLEEIGSDSQEKSSDILPNTTPNSPSFPVPSEMPVKVKSRWRRSSELEMGASSPANSPLASPSLPQQHLPSVAESPTLPEEEVVPLSKEAYDKIIQDRMDQYQHLEENEYLCERMISKETKKMICDCFMTKEELERGELACGEDCLNRLLMIECNSRCPVGDRCTNRRFQKREIGPLKVFYADKKGCGVEVSEDVPAGEFLMEYVGEVLDYEQFYKRAQAYSDENNLHHYFMSLKGDTVIDATLKGNISRFINHSCDPNAETQKWTVNGELRIGFFSKRDIVSGEELTFDYQFQRFGKVAQRCYCGASNCRGWIGGEPDSEDEEDEEEEDVSTSKTDTSESTEESLATPTEAPRPKIRRPKKDRTYKSKAPDLVQDADIEDDLEALSRTGVKNQSHTLRLSRTVVRAKSRRAQGSLLRLLRDADLPCRRLFLDYRGLRLLAPWCSDAPLDFKLEMLLTVDRLPIPNKTMVQESRFFTIVERWLSAADAPVDNVFIDEATGLPTGLPNSGNQENVPSPEKEKDNASILEKIKDLSSQLLERWSSLKEVFKIPKKERIQQMKEHERQANVERRAADSSGSRDRDRDRRDDRERRDDRDRDRDKERERDRDRDRERDRDRDRDRGERDRDRYRERERERDRDRDRDDRDRRKRRSSPEGRRSIRLNERVLASVPPMSKEERRRAFAEAAAAADESRRQRARDVPAGWPYWSQHDAFPQQMFPGSMVGGVVCGVPGLDMPPDWMPPHPGHAPHDFQGPPFCPPFPGPQPFCMPQPNMMGMAGFGMGGFMFGQQMAGGPPFQPQPLPDGAQPPPGVASVPLDPKEVVLPSLWRSATDPRGRTYYYHVKLRQPQWLPPPAPTEAEESSSDEEEEQINSGLDSPLIRRQSKGKVVEGVNGIYEVIKDDTHNGLIPDHALVSLKPRKRRPGLVSERPISPRTEEDKLAGRLEVKRYKQTKEKLRRRREKLIQKVRLLAANKHRKIKGSVLDLKQMVDLVDSETDSEEDSVEELPVEKPPSPLVLPSPEPEVEPENMMSTEETARKIKEQFRCSMARVMVQHLNPYRSSSATTARITCTADFKHLARKLTHFVMLKELKHCRSVDELVVTDSVRSKAKMFVKKYMAKFGPVYNRPPEEAD